MERGLSLSRYLLSTISEQLLQGGQLGGGGAEGPLLHLPVEQEHALSGGRERGTSAALSAAMVATTGSRKTPFIVRTRLQARM
jgi:hypothetical protein